jgi:sortase A
MQDTQATDGAQGNDLSVEELETLLLARRHEALVTDVQRYTVTERQIVVAQREARERPKEVLKPSRSPDEWRGANGHDRYFRSLGFAPLNGGAARQALPAGGDAAAKRAWPSVLLLIFEIAVALALVAVVVISIVRLRELNRQVRTDLKATVAATATRPSLPSAAPTSVAPAVVAYATVTPTTTLLPTEAQSGAVTSPPESVLPTVAYPVELPGGHESSTDSALTAPLQETAVATATVSVSSTPVPGAPVRMIIPKIGVDAPVVAGDDWETLKQGIGHRQGTANPGESGNMVVSAHNDIYGEIFRDLLEVEPGDEVLVYTESEAYRYIVDSVEIVSPTKVEVMDPTDYPALTMITCYPYLLDTHRVVAVAHLAD